MSGGEKDRPDLLAIAAENVVELSAECARLRTQIEAVERFLDAARGQKVGADFVIGRIDTILATRKMAPRKEERR